jgi:hypothetical protein
MISVGEILVLTVFALSFAPFTLGQCSEKLSKSREVSEREQDAQIFGGRE